jgi:hypothetical protein
MVNRTILFICAGWLAVLPPAGAQTVNPGVPTDPARGGLVGWARLETADRHWRRHSKSDGNLSGFIRTQTSLNLDPTWYAVKPAELTSLVRYPLIFSTDLSFVVRPAEVANLAEYLDRGGFFLVDSCINTHDVNPDPDVFLKANTEAFRRICPRAEIRPLPPEHEIYRCYFALKETPPHSYMNTVYDATWARHPLYGVFTPERMIGVISLSGLQCGWDRMTPTEGHTERCMQMVVNIYVHAMTR